MADKPKVYKITRPDGGTHYIGESETTKYLVVSIQEADIDEMSSADIAKVLDHALHMKFYKVRLQLKSPHMQMANVIHSLAGEKIAQQAMRLVFSQGGLH